MYTCRSGLGRVRCSVCGSAAKGRTIRDRRRGSCMRRMEMERKWVGERWIWGGDSEKDGEREFRRDCIGWMGESDERGERREKLYAIVMATDGRVAGCCFGPRRERTHKISRAPDAGKIKIRRIYISSVRYWFPDNDFLFLLFLNTVNGDLYRTVANTVNQPTHPRRLVQGCTRKRNVR